MNAKETRTSAVECKQFLSVREAAEFLDVTRATLYTMAYLKMFPKYKPNGGRVYFKRSDLERYIESGFVSDAADNA